MQLGWPAIDALHAEFDRAVCALAAAGDGDQAAVLAALERHMRAHFGTEEALMRAAGLAVDCHRHEHEAVLGVVAEVRYRLQRGDHEVARRLADELPAWFDAHIAAQDGPLVLALRAATQRTAESLARYALACVGAAHPPADAALPG